MSICVSQNLAKDFPSLPVYSPGVNYEMSIVLITDVTREMQANYKSSRILVVATKEDAHKVVNQLCDIGALTL